MGGLHPSLIRPTRVQIPNDISIGLAVFAGLTDVTDRPTNHTTRSVTIGRVYVRSTAMRPNSRSSAQNGRGSCKGADKYPVWLKRAINVNNVGVDESTQRRDIVNERERDSRAVSAPAVWNSRIHGPNLSELLETVSCSLSGITHAIKHL